MGLRTQGGYGYSLGCTVKFLGFAASADLASRALIRLLTRLSPQTNCNRTVLTSIYAKHGLSVLSSESNKTKLQRRLVDDPGPYPQQLCRTPQ